MMNTGKCQLSTPSDLEVLVTREFNAPRQLVYDAFTKPELLKRWMYGFEGWTLAVCDMDVRPGGKIRWVWRGRDGNEMGLKGVYKEVVPAERLVHTEIFDEDWTGGETLVTFTFTELGGKTTCAMTVVYSSKEARDGALKTGMVDGMEIGYARLDKMFAETAG
jgi:uncharacterized protein YndB with AHSA1/START domain